MSTHPAPEEVKKERVKDLPRVSSTGAIEYAIEYAERECDRVTPEACDPTEAIDRAKAGREKFRALLPA
jgi:hypothetical protein